MRANLVKILFFILAYLAISTLLYFYFAIDKKNRTTVYLTQQIEKLKSEFKATKNTYDKLGSFVYDELTSDKRFLELLQKGDRSSIYNYLLPYYKILRRYNIQYLTLLGPDGKTLLKMHKPTLKPTRSTKPFAENESRLMIEFKKPIYMQNRLIGFFKSAISYNVLKSELQRLFKGYYEYVIKSHLINKDIFRYGNYLFIQSDLNPRYFYEESSYRKQNSKAKELIHAINLTIKDLVANRLGQNANFALVTRVNGTYYVVSFLAISYNDTHIGYLISYKKDDTIKLFNTIFLQNLLFSNLLVIIFLAFIYYFLHVRYRFEEMAVTDKLTGLFNRHKLYEIADHEVTRSKRTGEPFSIIIFDIDHFKKINDTYGHDVGDYVLAAVAKLVQKHIRKYDYLFRWGGEEFVILSPHTDSKGAYKLAEKIRRLIESFEFEKVGHISVSLGVSQFYPETDENIESVIKRADNALYQSKREGRNKTNIAL